MMAVIIAIISTNVPLHWALSEVEGSDAAN